MPKITMIFSECAGLLGNGNELVVHNREDMQHFKRSTVGRTVVMGRRTVESLPAKLADRHLVMLTQQPDARHPFADSVAHSVEQVLEQYADADEIVVAGGAQVYSAFLPYATQLIVTHFDASTELAQKITKFDDPIPVPNDVKRAMASGRTCIEPLATITGGFIVRYTLSGANAQ